MSRILVIRLGALGDFVLSFGPFAAIRARHARDEITLLTTAPFASLARRAPWFDRVEVDARPSWWNLPGLARLRHQLAGFDMVYDLQTSGRSSWYFLPAGRPSWSGIARGCSHPHANPRRDFMHTLERQREQLEAAGVTAFPRPELGWLTRKPALDLPERFALLVPGAAPSRPRKRWPAECYGAVAAGVAEAGLVPVVVGTAAEAPLAATIRASCPAALDLTGGTTIADIAGLAARAVLAVGNDTGPMHLAAAVGCRCVVLFSADSDPVLTAPRGPDGAWPVVLRAPDLADLPAGEVIQAVASLLS
ncbi:ADP-heptose--lipooligosaccharide heptosyltransferase II [Rhodovastum atsumiense]|uniref:Glycosyltransferase family 9 protein n=1 Tax=Rhodovastum atsumiense TaxID=504468 RepID=A0A5M6J156_9PROT|nr:glycosyltransferase family 9 protein [Rhodovastum atsumiense]KAA5614322.1 glycosyltransferase family 9 protein [Rhodovastum atsumiense]CAH2604789.1 ADP-heptose--lipooligosaccharide heptosyltransferase II [Rhodovastum atsumiense]